MILKRRQLPWHRGRAATPRSAAERPFDALLCGIHHGCRPYACWGQAITRSVGVNRPGATAVRAGSLPVLAPFGDR